MSTNTDIQKLPQPDQIGYQKTTMNIPSDVHKAVRIAAIHRGIDAQDIWIEAVRIHLNLLEGREA